jgi:hypothetical protein
MAKKSGLDYASCRILCSHLLLYKNKALPYKQDFTIGIDEPYNWWASLEPDSPLLQEFALSIFSICPNSASCERGFSICGWITNKRRLRLSVEHLESMLKLITFYRSNASTELGFFGKGNTPRSNKLNDDEINSIVNETIAEADDDDDDETNVDDEPQIRRTTEGYVIPSNEVIVWIENTFDLSNKKITDELGEIPDNDLDDLEEEVSKEIEEEEEDEVEGRGVMDYDVEDLCKEFAQ